MVVEVKTEADAIVDLVKKYGEISIDQLSKRTGIQRDVLEQILHFLEEEGYVTLNYGLTNTFVRFAAKTDKQQKQKLKTTPLDSNELDTDFDYKFASITSETLKKHFLEIELMIHKLLFLELSLDLVQWKSLYLYLKKFLLAVPQVTSYLEEHDKVRIKELTGEIESLLDRSKQAIKDKDVVKYFATLKNIYLTAGELYRLFSQRKLNSLNSLLVVILRVIRRYLTINSKKESLFDHVNKVIDGIRKEDVNSVEENYSAIVELLENENFYELNEMTDEQKKDFNDALNVLTNQLGDVKSIDKYFDKYLKQKEVVLKNYDINQLDVNLESIPEAKSFDSVPSHIDYSSVEQFKAALFNDLKDINQKFNIKLSELRKGNKNIPSKVKEKPDQKTKVSVQTPTRISDSDKNISDKKVESLDELQSKNNELRFKDQESLKKIQVSLVKIQRVFDEGNIEEALTLLSQAKKILSSVSNNYFLLKKLEVAREVYTLESKIVERYIENNKERINKIFNEICNRINELDKLIPNVDRDSFNQLYTKLKELVNSIPERFSFEKNQMRTLLLKKLIDFYVSELRLNQQKTEKAKSEFLKLRKLFEHSEKRHDYVRMMLVYSRMSNLVNSLKDSEFKLTLLKDLDLIYVKVLDVIEKDRKLKYEKFKRLFAILFGQIEKSINEKKFDAASEQYHKLVLLMNKSPPGFFEENAKLKEQMNELYQKMVSEMERIKESLLRFT